jgi:hypothetical protein
LMAALLAGAAVLVSIQLSSNRSTELTKTGITALYCAEAGLTASKATVALHQPDWEAAIAAGGEPTWLASPGIDHDIDNDGNPDFEITLEDNFDETSGADDPDDDIDGKIYVVSTCTKYPDTPRQVRELVTYTQVTHCYSAQKGGCGGNGNMN